MASTARIEELKKKFDENPRRYFAPLANEYRKAGDLAAAIAICRAHLPQQPGHMSGHIVFGQALFESGQFLEAQTVFQTALELDPENLIALRHLGDIARQLGDPETARAWYQRVLDADPRNEEIGALIASLQGQSTPQPAPASAPDATPAPAAAFEPIDLAPVELPAAPLPPEPAPPAAAQPSPEPATPIEEMEISIPASWAHASQPAAGPVAGAEPPAPVASPLPVPAPPAAAGDHTLDGLETTSFEPPMAAAPTAEGLETMSFEAPAISPPPAAGLEGLEPTSWEPAPAPLPAVARAPEPPPVPEFPAELSFEQEPADSAPLQTGEHDVPAPADEGSFAPLAGLPMLEDAREGAADEAPAAEPAAAFVTETMADLLLAQGHRDQALGVFRQLVAQHPDDAALRDRMARLEASRGPSVREFLGAIASWRPAYALPSAGIPTVEAPVEPAPAEPASYGFVDHASESDVGLNGAARHDPAANHTATNGNGAASFDFARTLEPTPPAPQAAQPPAAPRAPTPTTSTRISGSYAVDESYVPPESPRPRSDPTPRSQPQVSAPPQPAASGSLDALFGNTSATADEGAARALAAAFTPLSTPATAAPPAPEQPVDLLSGRPARKTERELSLDHIFRNTGAVPRQSGGPAAGVSFDQFFGGETQPASGTPESSVPAAEVPQDGDDIQQFNSWLQGLRNR